MLLSTAGCQLSAELDEKKVEVCAILYSNLLKLQLIGCSLNARYCLLEVPGSIFYISGMSHICIFF
jgi:hypothetical protein